MFCIRRNLGVDLPLDVLLKNPTVSGIALAIGHNNGSSISSSSPNGQQQEDIHQYLQSEVNALDSLIKPFNLSSPTNPANTTIPTDILLTGATGFVGVFLLKKLLDSTPMTTRIHCLVRANNSIDGKQRLQQSLRIYKLWNDQFENRYRYRYRYR